VRNKAFGTWAAASAAKANSAEKTPKTVRAIKHNRVFIVADSGAGTFERRMLARKRGRVTERRRLS